jgi:hypothetical protein
MAKLEEWEEGEKLLPRIFISSTASTSTESEPSVTTSDHPHPRQDTNTKSTDNPSSHEINEILALRKSSSIEEPTTYGPVMETLVETLE